MTTPPASHAGFVIDRIFDAASARVFAAFAEPAARMRWFGAPPEPWQPMLYEHDSRIGGREHLDAKQPRRHIPRRRPAMPSKSGLFAVLVAAASLPAMAAPAHYTLDPSHTYPSFTADHMGISYWRGKFDNSRGNVTLDRAARSGTVDVTVELASVDFGMDRLNDWAKGPQFFDVARHPQAVYRGRLADFRDGAPTRVIGTLSLHGVTRPVDLTIDRFKCIPDPLLKRERCGADARGTFRRDAFGLDAGRNYGFDMRVTLQIQVEALKDA